jgi:hypothetical protein
MNELCLLITENFWQILLIVSMISIKKYRPFAFIILLLAITLGGFRTWMYIVLLIIVMFISITEEARADEKPKEPKRKDPDYE